MVIDKMLSQRPLFFLRRKFVTSTSHEEEEDRKRALGVFSGWKMINI